MKKLLLIFLTFSLFGCTPKEETLETFSNITVTAGFDTYFSLQVATTSQEEFSAYFSEAVDDFTNFNNLFDIYNTSSEINNLKSINDQAGIQPLEVDQSLIDMLLMAKNFHDLSNGGFDITIGAVLQVWHRYREQNDGSIPSIEEIQAAQACTGWEYVEIDDDANTVFITNPCVSLDVGGIAKGFATEEIAQELIAKDVAMAVVDAGGNNRIINSKLDGTDWRVGIQNPDAGGSLLVVSQSGSTSFVTSGDYQRFFIGADGIRYHHIIDPKSGYPANYFRSVTIITENSAIADAFSTLLFTQSYEDGIALVQEYNETHLDDPISVIWVVDIQNKIDNVLSLDTQNYQCIYTEDLEGKIEVVQ
ncbi:MAG: FAD:protein FMN transferase [Anaerorhabdus sp.]